MLHAQPTSFTYQGRLSNEGEPADGAHDFTFTLKDAANLGSTVGAPLLVTDVPVVDGLFTAMLDFTAAPFDGNPRWLEIAVRPAEGAGDFTTLVPRQAISPTPYATRALSAGTATSAATAGFASSVAAGSVGEEQLAAGAAAANLAAGGQSGVAPGGLVLSPTDNPELVAAGYTRVGSTSVGDHWELSVPGDVPQRAKHTAVWTGTHLLVWGGSESENGGVLYDPATGKNIRSAGKTPRAPEGSMARFGRGWRC